MFNLFNFNFYVTIKYNWNVKYLRVLKGVNRFSKIIFFIFLKQNTIYTSSILMFCVYMNLKIVTNGVQDRFTTLAMPSDVLWGILQHTHTCTHPYTHICISQFTHSVTNHRWMSLKSPSFPSYRDHGRSAQNYIYVHGGAAEWEVRV